MAIVKMKQLKLLAMLEDREEMLRTLQGLGCVEISEPSPSSRSENEEEQAPAQELLSQLSSPDTRALSQAQARHHDAQHAMDVLRHYGAKGRSFLSPKPCASREELYGQEAVERQDQAVANVLAADRQISTLLARQEKLASQRTVLAPWMDLDVPLNTASTPGMMVQFGTLATAHPFENAVQAVQSVSELACLTQASASRELRYCLLVCHTDVQDAVLEALRAFGWARVDLSGWSGTAKENDATLCAQQAQAQAELEQARSQLAAMSSEMDELCRAADRATLDIHLQEGRARLRDTRQTFFLQGWVPAERWEEVKAGLARYPCAWEVSDPPESDYPQVPVQLKNNWFTRPLNMVTEMYSLPAYGTVDPNPLMAPFFIAFYGVMMADMGYGLLMMLAAVFVLKKAKPKAGMHNFFMLLGLCGVSTFVMGAVTGGFFGDFLTQLTTLVNPDAPLVLPSLFTPLNDTMMILIGAMCLGVVQIITGMAVSAVRKVASGKFWDAFWEEITWWVVFAGIGLAALGITNLVLYVGGALVVAGPLITGKGLGKITGVFASLYNHVTGYFGDILSYSRLMALMLAGSVIAQVFNTLGAIPGNVIVFLIISAAGNALNFALNLLGCYVHDLRLQCLEYFGKFYEDGGRPFRPLDLSAKYYDISK